MKDTDIIKKGLECCSRCTNEDPFAGCEDCPYNEISISVQECRSVLCLDTLELIRGD